MAMAVTPNCCLGKKKQKYHSDQQCCAAQQVFTRIHACAHMLQALARYLAIDLIVPDLCQFSWQSLLPCFLDFHRQEQPAIAQRAFMSGPLVQHRDFKTHPAQIFGQVFTSIGVAVQADDQLIAVDAVGTCKLEEGGEAVKE